MDVERILRALKAPPGLIAEVTALARIANTEWQDYRSLLRKGLDKGQVELAEVEKITTEFRFFLLSMITGLLSTPEYIKASLDDVEGDLGKVISKKLERQAVLYDQSKSFTFILTEQAVRFTKIPPHAMAIQIDHLVSLSHLPAVRLGVIPVDTYLPGCPLTTFTVYDECMATVEASTGVMMFRDPPRCIRVPRRIRRIRGEGTVRGSRTRTPVRMGQCLPFMIFSPSRECRSYPLA